MAGTSTSCKFASRHAHLVDDDGELERREADVGVESGCQMLQHLLQAH